MTIGAALEMGRCALQTLSDTPSLDSQLLLCEVLRCPRAWILAHPEAPLEDVHLTEFIIALTRYQHGEALPYVLGWWEFYGRRFRLTPAVLIPRPETELMVEEALSFLTGRTEIPLAADIGTGSGCVAITLAAEVPDLRIVASDLSAEALRVARSNSRDHGVESRVHLLQADLLTPLAASFGLICANLPYIPTPSLSDLEVARREPQVALDGGADGLAVIRRMLAQLPGVLAHEGRALFEIGAGQGKAVRDLANAVLPNSLITLRLDLAQHDRLLVVDGKREK
jgi:release factor glutamine methyltransferase